MEGSHCVRRLPHRSSPRAASGRPSRWPTRRCRGRGRRRAARGGWSRQSRRQLSWPPSRSSCTSCGCGRWGAGERLEGRPHGSLFHSALAKSATLTRSIPALEPSPILPSECLLSPVEWQPILEQLHVLVVVAHLGRRGEGDKSTSHDSPLPSSNAGRRLPARRGPSGWAAGCRGRRGAATARCRAWARTWARRRRPAGGGERDREVGESLPQCCRCCPPPLPASRRIRS